MSKKMFYVPETTRQLQPFIDVGLFDASCVYLADAICRQCNDARLPIQLAIAAAARAPQFGHVCVPVWEIQRSIMSEELTDEQLELLPWPTDLEWEAALTTSDAVWVLNSDTNADRRPLVFDNQRLYLNRLWNYEQQVATALQNRVLETSTLLPISISVNDLIRELCEQHHRPDNGSQLEAVGNALIRRFSVIAGGPGTGKTHTIATLMIALAKLDSTMARSLRVGLCAPTGKAASRMTEAIGTTVSATIGLSAEDAFLQQLHGSTIQRMLGVTYDGHYRFNETNPLPYDLIVVDEASMISLPLMNSLLQAMRLDTSLVLVGDPNQLASVEAGAVLGDIVQAASNISSDVRATQDKTHHLLRDAVTTLTKTHRFAEASEIATCAELTSAGDANGLMSFLCRKDLVSVQYLQQSDREALVPLMDTITSLATKVVQEAQNGNAEEALLLLSSTKVFCATHYGDYGSYQWTHRIEQSISHLATHVDRVHHRYVGQPLIATKNDYVNNIFNGDVGVVTDRDGRMQVAMRFAEGLRWYPLSQWADAEPWWTMTIHRSQGSEFENVLILLPEAPMPLLTRELLYTAITRAKRQIAIVGNDEVLRATVGRRIGRSTGLTALLAN